LINGSFESERAVFEFSSHNVPEPIAWGRYKSRPDTYFYICDFHNMTDELPDKLDLAELTAKLHQDSMGKSPGGQFGFHVTTHLSDIPMYSAWYDTWEGWFANAMKNMISVEEDAIGRDEELSRLTTALFEMVIPRLMRPMETGGRKLEASLCHGDLWPGNIKHEAETRRLMIFDSCAYWGHNECASIILANSYPS
jgi:protein-ribulosamine 3-kinase